MSAPSGGVCQVPSSLGMDRPSARLLPCRHETTSPSDVVRGPLPGSWRVLDLPSQTALISLLFPFDSAHARPVSPCRSFLAQLSTLSLVEFSFSPPLPWAVVHPRFFSLSLLSFIRSIFPPFSGRRTLLLLSRRQFHPTESLRSLSRSFGTQQRQQAGSGVRVRVQSQSLFLDLDTYPSHQQGECASRICSSGSQEQQHPTVTARTNGRAARRLVITHNANE